MKNVKRLIKVKFQMVLINFARILSQNLYFLFLDFSRTLRFFKYWEVYLDEYFLQDEDLNEAFNSLKSNKSPGFDKVSSKIVKRCGEHIFDLIKYVLDFSLKQGAFAESLKIACASPIFIKDEMIFIHQLQANISPPMFL